MRELVDAHQRATSVDGAKSVDTPSPSNRAAKVSPDGAIEASHQADARIGERRGHASQIIRLDANIGIVDDQNGDFAAAAARSIRTPTLPLGVRVGHSTMRTLRKFAQHGHGRIVQASATPHSSSKSP